MAIRGGGAGVGRGIGSVAGACDGHGLLGRGRGGLVARLHEVATLRGLELCHAAKRGESLGEMQIGRQKPALYDLEHARGLVHVRTDDVVVLQRGHGGRPRAVLLSDDPEIGLPHVGQDVLHAFELAEFLLPQGVDHVGGQNGSPVRVGVLEAHARRDLARGPGLCELLLHLGHLVVGSPVKERGLREVVEHVVGAEPEGLDPLGRLPLELV